MEPSDRPPVVLGGLAFALCPLCLGIPVLIGAGMGSGLALAIGGVVIGGVALVVLAAGALVVLRRRRDASCCEPAVQGHEQPGGSRSALRSEPANPVRP